MLKLWYTKVIPHKSKQDSNKHNINNRLHGSSQKDISLDTFSVNKSRHFYDSL